MPAEIQAENAGSNRPSTYKTNDDKAATICLLVNEIALTVAVFTGQILAGILNGWGSNPFLTYTGILIGQSFLALFLSFLAWLLWKRFSFAKLVSYAVFYGFRVILYLIIGAIVIAWWYAMAFLPICLIPSSCFVMRIQMKLKVANRERRERENRRQNQQLGSRLAMERRYENQFPGFDFESWRMDGGSAYPVGIIEGSMGAVALREPPMSYDDSQLFNIPPPSYEEALATGTTQR